MIWRDVLGALLTKRWITETRTVNKRPSASIAAPFSFFYANKFAFTISIFFQLLLALCKTRAALPITQHSYIQRAHMTNSSVTCPCSSQKPFEECCGPILKGLPAPTAEALMRARYTAFARRELDFVEQTHAPELREDFNRAEAERFAEECEWKGLEIRSIQASQAGTEIEFLVKFRRQGEPQDTVNGARSMFKMIDGKWFFASSRALAITTPRRVNKIGRNDPCPCGSGKKAKNCCGTTTELA